MSRDKVIAREYEHVRIRMAANGQPARRLQLILPRDVVPPADDASCAAEMREKEMAQ